MIYNKPIDAITWDDIELFCQGGQPEGAYLDYKGDFPSDLAKTIAAMANTSGGIILIGVDEDKQSKPVTPITGINFDRGLSERVINIVLDSITPPVFPEVQVCIDPSGQKAALVIRVPESHETPHATLKNTKVYLRTGNRNSQEELAAFDKIEWLINKRAKSEALRERLNLQASQRFVTLYDRTLSRLRSEGKTIREWDYIGKEVVRSLPKFTEGWITLSIGPLYPKEMLKTPPMLRNLKDDICVSNYFQHASDQGMFPPFDRGSQSLIQDGFVYTAAYGYRAYHTELNCFGLYFHKQVLMRLELDESGRKKASIDIANIMRILDQFIDSATKFYEQLGYWGCLDFHLHLDCPDSCQLTSSLQFWSFGGHYPCPDPEISFSEIVLTRALASKKAALMLDIIQRISWGFGLEVSDEIVERFFEEYKLQNET